MLKIVAEIVGVELLVGPLSAVVVVGACGGIVTGVVGHVVV